MFTRSRLAMRQRLSALQIYVDLLPVYVQSNEPMPKVSSKQGNTDVRDPAQIWGQPI